MLRRLHFGRFFSTSPSVSAPRVAVVGSGPAGLFTCTSLLRKHPSCMVDVFDASPVPFGLVRYGVAPDHQEVKNCIHGFEKTFDGHPDRMRLFCNVKIGSDIKFEELCSNYDAVLLAYGAHRPRKLSIPGAEAENVISGSHFVSWYNGVPNVPPPILQPENAVIIGNGNVALDCARILSSIDKLSSTDIPDESLDLLKQSKIDNIKIVGRRGPSNISFTIKELREQFKVESWTSFVSLVQSEIDELEGAITVGDRRRKRLLQVLKDHIALAPVDSDHKRCSFLFNRIPKEVIQNSSGKVEGVRFHNRLSNESEDHPCGLLIYSIGYETMVLDGVPKNEKGMIRMVDDCRVDHSNCAVFASGWCAHGPKGVIVDTQQQSVFVAQEMANYLAQGEKGVNGVDSLLSSRDIPFVSWNDWKSMDEKEQCMGKEKGKVREKITHFNGYLKKSAKMG